MKKFLKNKLIKKVTIATMLLCGFTGATIINSEQAHASTKKYTYTVVKGDTLSKIAKKKKTTITKLKKLNKLKSNLIFVGQKLKYKGTIKTTVKTASKKKIKKTSNDISVRYLKEGKKYLGVPYVWGGTTRSGMDCSGFVYRTLKDSGKNVTRLTSGGLYAKYRHVSKSNLDRGDLVFFAENGSRITHVAFYYGDGKILHSAGSKVQINNIDNGYWKQRIVGYASID